jgi:hypothetical protein
MPDHADAIDRREPNMWYRLWTAFNGPVPLTPSEAVERDQQRAQELETTALELAAMTRVERMRMQSDEEDR